MTAVSSPQTNLAQQLSDSCALLIGMLVSNLGPAHHSRQVELRLLPFQWHVTA